MTTAVSCRWASRIAEATGTRFATFPAAGITFVPQGCWAVSPAGNPYYALATAPLNPCMALVLFDTRLLRCGMLHLDHDTRVLDLLAFLHAMVPIPSPRPIDPQPQASGLTAVMYTQAAASDECHAPLLGGLSNKQVPDGVYRLMAWLLEGLPGCEALSSLRDMTYLTTRYRSPEAPRIKDSSTDAFSAPLEASLSSKLARAERLNEVLHAWARESAPNAAALRYWDTEVPWETYYGAATEAYVTLLRPLVHPVAAISSLLLPRSVAVSLATANAPAAAAEGALHAMLTHAATCAPAIHGMTTAAEKESIQRPWKEWASRHCITAAMGEGVRQVLDTPVYTLLAKLQ